MYGSTIDRHRLGPCLPIESAPCGQRFFFSALGTLRRFHLALEDLTRGHDPDTIAPVLPDRYLKLFTPTAKAPKAIDDAEEHVFGHPRDTRSVKYDAQLRLAIQTETLELSNSFLPPNYSGPPIRDRLAVTYRLADEYVGHLLDRGEVIIDKMIELKLATRM